MCIRDRYKPYENLVYWRQVPTNTTWLALSTIFSLFFFTKVCEHMLLLLKRKKARFSHSISTLPFHVQCSDLGVHGSDLGAQSFHAVRDNQAVVLVNTGCQACAAFEQGSRSPYC